MVPTVIILNGFIQAGSSLENMTPPFTVKLKEFSFMQVSLLYFLFKLHLCMYGE